MTINLYLCIDERQSLRARSRIAYLIRRQLFPQPRTDGTMRAHSPPQALHGCGDRRRRNGKSPHIGDRALQEVFISSLFIYSRAHLGGRLLPTRFRRTAVRHDGSRTDRATATESTLYRVQQPVAQDVRLRFTTQQRLFPRQMDEHTQLTALPYTRVAYYDQAADTHQDCTATRHYHKRGRNRRGVPGFLKAIETS